MDNFGLVDLAESLRERTVHPVRCVVVVINQPSSPCVMPATGYWSIAMLDAHLLTS